MSKFIDISGGIFYRWTVLKYAGKIKGQRHWVCQCSCTKKTIRNVSESSLKHKKSKSCGCYSREKSK